MIMYMYRDSNDMFIKIQKLYSDLVDIFKQILFTGRFRILKKKNGLDGRIRRLYHSRGSFIRYIIIRLITGGLYMKAP